ncbi:hypothetical protein GUITHDRAFT_165991 [Guillardia theta CCMP2712]|uniref:protein disulfide-isomerase n=1 Tax=Guillardia theta (strain CCMP2712) TaxID=905079 RepID=L1IHE5_GUITC|nr:hypothetical protein GUITHDRAFT_165991 [Guillardia theta CCMP2712]EKX35324.1 hypothetical protein GUITHDRAFT_165991 [Guillardia theta CCMP2712]|eukprot:XP_005822304.1 hypothetical protein GUITHDRAFT_165991 [Guillardia theta CCMP2712]
MTRLVRLSFLILCLLSSHVTADEGAYSSIDDVLILTSENFDREVAKHTEGDKALLVEFYAPWCGHCKALKPKYIEAAKKLMQNNPPIRIAAVNADEESNKNLASRFGVSGFPTLKVLKDGGSTVLDYDGPRETDGIVKHVLASQGPTWTEVTEKEEVERQRGAGKRVALFVGKEPREASKAFAAFKEAAAKLKGDVTMLACFNEQVAKEFGLTAPSVSVFTEYKAEGARHEKLEEKLNDAQHVQNFINDMARPLVSLVGNSDEHGMLMKTDLPIMKMFVNGKDSSDRQNRKNMFRNRISKVAMDYKNKITFAVSDDVEGGASYELEEYGISSSDLPAIVIRKGNLKYKFDPKNEEEKKFKASTFKAFADDYLAGNKYGNIVIAKFDATANDSPHGELQAQGYPTIKFIAAGDNKISDYTGERDAKSIVDWVKREAK